MVRLTGGTYFIGQPIKIGSNIDFLMDRDVVLVRNFAGGALSQATIVNEARAAGNSNIRLSGGTITTQGNTSAVAGKHLGFDNVKNLSIDDVRFPRVYQHWTAAFRDCQDVTISNVVIGDGVNSDDEIHEDGLHFAGGMRITITNANIYTGDDCISLTHEPAADFAPATDLSLLTVSNSTLTSVRANAIRVWAHPSYDGGKTISRVRFSNIIAKVGFALGGDTTSMGIWVADETAGPRLISDVALDGVTLDASQNSTSANVGHGLVVRRVDRVQLTGVRIYRPDKSARIDDANDVELRDCAIVDPRSTGQNCLTVAGLASCTNLRVLGGLYRKAKGHAIRLGITGTPSYSVQGFQVFGSLLDEAGLNGLMIWNGVDGIVIGNTINNCGTTMTAGSGFGIQEVHPASNRNLIIGNQLTNNFGGPVRFDGPDTEVARNLGGISVNTSDSGGFRQTVDGWNQNGGLTGTAIEIQQFGLNPVSGGAGRFRAVRPGSVTGIVITSDTAWTAGTLTVEVYINNSGTAGGAIIGTGLTTLLDSAHTKRNSNTQAKDISKFLPGDELTIVYTAASWAPTNANIRCALEIED